jgi:Family of unknown function (DUF5691)
MSTWQDLVTASLIGTERTGVPAITVPGLPAMADAAGDPAAILLGRAALLAAARRAGRPPEHAEPLPVAEPDPAPAVGPAASHRLARMLGGEYPDLLTEWLTAAVTRGLRAPAQLLPALLDRARRVSPTDPELRRLAAEAGGSRARWLAGLNPDWKFVTAHILNGDDAWRLGDAHQRRGYLTALRARDPGAARELIAASWDAAGPERVMFLSVLADEPAGPRGSNGPKGSKGSTGLNLADEPLLEAALGAEDVQGAEEVRGWAAYLLASLPGSALGQRMAERARRCLRLDRGIRGMRLLVSPPAECDAAMRRDGIMPGPGAGGSQLADRTRLMLEVLARAPLRTWTDEFLMTPATIVTVRSGDWAPVLFSGWSRAAIAQRDQDWMAALITEALTGRVPGTPAETAALRQLARRADPALGTPGVLPEPGPNAPVVLYDAASVLRFRYDMLKELDVDHSAD